MIVIILFFLTAYKLTCLLCFLLAVREMDLNFDNPEINEGMLVLKASEILIGQEVVEAVTIIRPLEDVEDFRQGRIQAQLLPDRSGIKFTLPSVASYLLDAKEIKALYEVEGILACMATKRAHDIAATDVQSDDERRLRHIIAYFPEGITCSNRHFNDGTDGLNLKTQLVMFQNTLLSKGGKAIPSLKPQVRWKVVVETGRTRCTALASGRDNYDADLETALGRMGVW